MKNEKIFITGGAGYLGVELIKRLHPDNEITIFSRNQESHKRVQNEFPKVRTIQGDIKDEAALHAALSGHTIAIFAGSLKRIDEVEKNVHEATRIIVDGAINARNAAVKNNLKAAFFISSDKSRMPTTLYGAMKLIAGESFIINAEQEKTKLNTIVCGNIINSTGSVIPLIWNAIKNKTTLTLFGEEMTRFMMDPDQVLHCITLGLDKTGHNIIPNLHAHKVKDLFEIYEEEFGLSWKLGNPRTSEKIHEQMISPYELGRTTFDASANIFFTHYKELSQNPSLDAKVNSYDYLLTKEDLRNYLKLRSFFKPND